MTQKKKKAVLRVIKKTYGEIPIEEAFKKALAPYFSKEDPFEKKIG